MATIYQVLDSVGAAIEAAGALAGITSPVQAFTGNPSYEDLTKVLQRLNQAQIALWPLEVSKSTTRFPAQWGTITPVSVTLGATVTNSGISFSGTPQTGINVHALIDTTGVSGADAYYQVQAGDTLASIATAVAAKINALALTGVSASASGPVVTVTGATAIQCNLCGSTAAGRIVRQIEQVFQVRIVTPNGDLRAQLEDVVLSNIGIDVDPGRKFPLPDGTDAWVKYRTHRWMDDMALDTFYESRVWFTADFPTVQTQTMYQIGATTMTVTENAV